MKKQVLTLYDDKTGDVVKVYKDKEEKTMYLEKDGIQIQISKNTITYLSKYFKENSMKKLIDKFIIFFSYKNPHLWLEINEATFDDIEDYKKKIYKKVLELIRKLK